MAKMKLPPKKKQMTYAQAITLLVKIAREKYQRLAPQANMYVLTKGSIGNGAGQRDHELRMQIQEAIDLITGQARMEL